MRAQSHLIGLSVGALLLIANAGGCGGDDDASPSNASSSSTSSSSSSGSTTSSSGTASGSSSGNSSSGDGGQTDGGGDSSAPTGGPTAACAATITSFTACGGTIPDGTWKVTSICSPAVTVTKSPVCGPGKGSTTFWYEGLLGAGQLDTGTNSLQFTSVRATGHYTSIGAQSCFQNNNDCKWTKQSLYGTGPTGDCTPQGTDCSCAWTAQPMSTNTGSSSYTTNGGTLTWFGTKMIPYCVAASGTTLTLDIASLFAAEDVPPGTPFVATFAKQ